MYFIVYLHFDGNQPVLQEKEEKKTEEYLKTSGFEAPRAVTAISCTSTLSFLRRITTLLYSSIALSVVGGSFILLKLW